MYRMRAVTIQFERKYIIFYNYTSIRWLEKDFLGYLDSWHDSVSSRPGFKPAHNKAMTLSAETLEGLRMSGML